MSLFYRGAVSGGWTKGAPTEGKIRLDSPPRGARSRGRNMAHTQQCRAVQYQAVEGGGVKSYRSTFESRACMWSEKEKTIIWEAKSDYQAPKVSKEISARNRPRAAVMSSR